MTWLTKAALAAALFTISAQASATGSHHDDHGDHHHHHHHGYYGKSCSTSRDYRLSSPLNYHATYASVESTLITIKDVYLKLAGGETIKVPGTAREIDLQDLSGFGKGIVISLAGVTFPANAPTASVVEIEVPIVNESSARAVSADGSECKLRVPRAINLYTTAPVTVIAGQDYRIGVDFTAIDDVQISVLNVVTTKKCCEFKKNKWRSDRKEKVCDSTSTTQSETKCKLANRRHLINKLVRPADEF